MRMVRHGHRLRNEAVDAPSMDAFKTRLDGALSNLVWRQVSLPVAGVWNYMILKALSNPYHSMIYLSLGYIDNFIFVSLKTKQCLSEFTDFET